MKKKYQVKTQFKEILEPEEILLDAQEKKKREKGKLEVKIQDKIFIFVFFIFSFLFLCLFLRTSFLVLAKGKEYQQKAIDNYLRKVYFEAPRGLIYSKDGELLVENIEDKNAKINSKEKEKRYYRNYLNNLYFSFILGYEREATEEELKTDPQYYEPGDWVGKDGVEKTYEKYLRGKKGILEKIVNAKGEVVSQKITRNPQIGDTLILNIDAKLQKKIYDAIQKKVPGKDAIAIALDPRNGAVLAMVSIPSNDNNVFSRKNLSAEYLQYLENQKRIYNINKAISARYPSGSIIKPLIAAAALEENVITPSTTIFDPGYIEIPNPYNPSKPTIKKDWKAHGTVDLKKAIAESCNTYFFTVGGGYKDIQGLGISRIKKYLDLFFIEDLLGIDLPGEAVGFVPTREWFEKEMQKSYQRNWSIADVYDVSIGQGFFMASPLHMAVALSSIANGGKIYQPQVVDKIKSPDGKVIKDIEPKVLSQGFISQKNIEEVKEGMRACVTSPSGSCRQLASLPVSSAGKTGTAESDKGDLTHSWFVAFAPYENPKIFILVLVPYGGEGSSVAEPIAKEVLEWYFKEYKK